MADNDAKTFEVNLAISKTKAGIQDTGELYSSGIDDSVFADFNTGENNTIKRAALYYETCLLRCLDEIRPDFAKRFADLGNRITINKEYGDWSCLFEKPSNFLYLIRQTDESSKKLNYDCQPLDFTNYAHTVTGSDDDVYVCTTAHTSADDTDDGEPPDDDGSGNWTLDSTDEYTGADWEESKAYKASQSGILLATNTLSNSDGDSAYIEYIPYEQAGINDDPTKYTESFKHAFATLLASEIETDFERRQKLLNEYELIAKPKAKETKTKDDHEKKTTLVVDARSNLRVG